MNLIVESYDNADDFLQAIRWGRPLTRNAGYGKIAFRGQGLTELPPRASAFRENCWLGYGEDRAINRGPRPTSEDQARLEYLSVRAFFRLSDQIGLPVPGDNQFFRVPLDVDSEMERSFRDGTWPPPLTLDTIAIAQHHGVPTRLLDFTYEPHVAAFFAAEGSLGKTGSKFAVWAIDLRLGRAVDAISEGTPSRLKIVTVPRASDAFLHAQHGLFILDPLASENWNGGAPPTIDEVASVDAAKWSSEASVRDYLQVSPADVLPIVRKVEAPSECAADVIKLFAHGGLTPAHITPNYRGVVTSLNLMDSLEP